MYGARRTFIATSLIALLAVAGVTAAIAADPAPAPPPRIAFLANGIVPADALAAGPIAGQLGAPVYTTQQDVLPAGTAAALDAYDPQLVVVMGGPVAISDAVVTQVAAATGLPVVDPSPTPATGVVRAAGGDRFETATIVADLLAAYAPAYLPVDLQAVDADLLDGKDASQFLAATAKAADTDLLDGKDSSEFLGASDKAADADLLDGKDATAFATGALLGGQITAAGSLVAGSTGISSVTSPSEGTYNVTFDRTIANCPVSVTPMLQARVAEVERPSVDRLFILTYPATNATGLAADRVDTPLEIIVFCP